MASKSKDEYTGKSIKELPYPQNVQQRPEMYIGTTSVLGILTCIREIVNNSVDEFLAGYATYIEVRRLGPLSFQIIDNGRGVPFDKHSSGRNTMEVIFGALHAGRNFEEKTVYSTGLFGVGSSCVNALSNEFIVTSTRGKKQGEVVFENGYHVETDLRDCKAGKGKFKESSTDVQFELNPSYFDKDVTVSDEEILRLLRYTAYLTYGLEIKYISDEVNTTYCFGDDGMARMLNEELGGDELFNPLIFKRDVVKKTAIQVSFTYSNQFESEEVIRSFCNTIESSDGGTHVTGFKRAISQKLVEYLKVNKLCKEKIDNKDIYSGLNAAVSVFVLNPKYASQTKQKLDNTDVNGHVVTYMNSMLDEWLASNPKEIKLIAAKIDLAARSRIAQKRAIANVKKDSDDNMFTALSNITKFHDCASTNPVEKELFIIEGDSAGGTVNLARDKQTQAIYKLKGKPLNTIDKTVTQARQNNEIDDLFSILRCGSGKDFDIEKLQFFKVVVLADADSDGKHIETLLLTLFASHLEQLIYNGHVYIALTPLYRAVSPGKPPVFLKDINELNTFFVNQIKENFKFNMNDKVSIAKLVTAMNSYKDQLESYAHELQITPLNLERVILNHITPELDIIEDKSLKRTEIYEDNDNIVISGFYNDSLFGEQFIYVNYDADRLIEIISTLSKIRETLLKIKSVVYNKSEWNLKDDAIYNIVSKVMSIINKQYSITRFKGLGEMQPIELWDTTLNPETRVLLRVMPNTGDESIQETISNYMDSGKKFINFRKELIKGITGSDSNLDDLFNM